MAEVAPAPYLLWSEFDQPFEHPASYTGEAAMAKTGPRNQITLKSTESHHCYYSSKNRRNQQARLEVKKYDPTLRKHVVYREER